MLFGNNDELIGCRLRKSLTPKHGAFCVDFVVEVSVAEYAAIGRAPVLGVQTGDVHCIGWDGFADLHIIGQQEMAFP